MANENGSGRLDRIEKVLELLIDDHVQFREEHKLLLTAQVVLTDRLDRLAQTVAQSKKDSDERLKATDERLRATDERLNALITIVDGLIRRPPA